MKTVFAVFQIKKDFFVIGMPPGTITTSCFELIGLFDDVEAAKNNMSGEMFPDWFIVMKMEQVQ
jgi:hypothetical protein